MAEFIKSSDKLTWDPSGTALVLLDHGERTLEEFTLPQTHAVQVQPFLKADFKKAWDRGNVHYEMEFSRVSDHATPQAMRNYKLSHSVAIAALRHATLKIEVENGDVYELRNAAITSCRPDMSKELVTAGRMAFHYRVTGGELVNIP